MWKCETSKFSVGLGPGPQRKDYGSCNWKRKPKDAAVGFQRIFKGSEHFCPVLLGVQEKHVTGSVPKDGTWPLRQGIYLHIIPGTLAPCLLGRKIPWVQKRWAEKWGHQKTRCCCSRNEGVGTRVIGRDKATDKQIISSGFWSTFRAEESPKKLESVDAGITHPLLEGSHLGGAVQRPF